MSYLQTSHLSRAMSADRYRGSDEIDRLSADDHSLRTRRARSVSTYVPYLDSDYSGYYRYIYSRDDPLYYSSLTRYPLWSISSADRIKPSYYTSSMYFPPYRSSVYRWCSPYLYSSYEPSSRYYWNYYGDLDDWVYRTRYCTGLGYLRAMRPLYSSILNNRLDYMYPTYDSPSYRRGILSELGYRGIYSPRYSRWIY